MGAQDLIAEARANIEHLAKGIPGSMADRVRAGEADDPRVSLIVRLADALEAAEVRAEQLARLHEVANDAREQLEVAIAEYEKLEQRYAQLARLHEVATDRTVQFAAVIEKAKAKCAAHNDPGSPAPGADFIDGLDHGAQIAYDVVADILASADTSAVLRARDAEKWDEGFNDCAKWWEIHHHGQVRDESNPYRQQEGADRG
jgi:hypothetical protein